MNTIWARARVALAVAVAIGCCGTGPAWAKSPDAEVRDTCPTQVIEQPFLAFDDARDYVLAPGGSFEDPALTGWSLTGGAAVAPGNEPFNLRSAQDGSSLKLPAGASATSPPACIDLNWPTLRFVGLQEAAKDAKLDVEVLYPDTEDGGELKWHKAKTLKASAKDGWHATKDVKLSPDRGGKLPGGRPVALRFTNDSDHGTWRIDNLYIDPRRH